MEKEYWKSKGNLLVRKMLGSMDCPCHVILRRGKKTAKHLEVNKIVCKKHIKKKIAKIFATSNRPTLKMFDCSIFTFKMYKNTSGMSIQWEWFCVFLLVTIFFGAFVTNSFIITIWRVLGLAFYLVVSFLAFKSGFCRCCTLCFVVCVSVFFLCVFLSVTSDFLNQIVLDRSSCCCTWFLVIFVCSFLV